MEMEFDKFCKALVSANYKPRAYTGRGMLHKKCVGISVEKDNQITNVLLNIVQCHLSDKTMVKDTINLLEDLRNSSYDSLGHDKIIYWPYITWQDPID